ncbi:alpha-L-fucosidase [Vagococcus sp. BWB3-3]|uniref:alpha-L-fucosidase n=1 Tax=Vagococcus allomyrinae TaxID=2794353 RepID=A0A940STS8_9ENTE|nr:alpha-L-fucosidase [Vagococcus allomyrinae]MBP1043482.1 alpha-L-fucosidase [Vagococcus allomyrinae]
MEQIRGDIEKASIETEEHRRYPETDMLAERLEWFQDLKLGVIIHWGLYAEAGIVESWQLSEEDEWAREPTPWRQTIKELQRDYWQLNQTFNPVKLDAADWARKCKAAGFNYLIYTTKHHDGFNMYDTALSDYKIGGKDSPYQGSDPLKIIFEAFRQEGLATGAYYSKADWHSPYYWLADETVKGRRASYDPLEHPDIWQKYVEFVHSQIHEITHNYGKIDFLWLDAGWSGKGKEDLQMDRFVEIAREEQPELIVVDRMMGGRHENYVTPERKVPSLAELPTKPWESNIPLGNDWGYNPADQFKSSQEVIETLVNVVSKGGNLILGLGPTPEGTFTKEEDAILEELGSWLRIYGDGIYGTRKLAVIDENQGWFLTQKAIAYYGFLPVTSPWKQQLNMADLGISPEEITEVRDMKTKQPLLLIKEGENWLINLPETCPESLGCYGIQLIKGYIHPVK